MEEDKIPGGEKLPETLQGSLCGGQNVFVAATEAVNTAMSSLLIKTQCSAESRGTSKGTRNYR